MVVEVRMLGREAWTYWVTSVDRIEKNIYMIASIRTRTLICTIRFLATHSELLYATSTSAQRSCPNDTNIVIA